jgi:hypothetical protein
MSMNHSKSYWKTLLLAAIGGSAIIGAATLLAQPQWKVASFLLLTVAWSLGGILLCVAASGLMVLYRDAHQRRTHSNLFQVANRARSEASVAQGKRDFGLWLRRVARAMVGSRTFIVGEVVEILSFDEIARTLDADNCVDALPFIAEMKRFCGQRARIFRRVDKIYDYGRTKTLLRLHDTFLLTHLRCDGSAHAGCQAGCYLLWKGRWLKRAGAGKANDVVPDTPARSAASGANSAYQASAAATGTKYVCQFTQLAAASSKMSTLDIRQDLRPLLSGNVTMAAFSVAMLTRFFNFAQRLRGGVGYPAAPSAALAAASPAHGLVPGDTVRVLDGEAIAGTLDKRGLNRGLWFDQDMLKYCGQVCVVRKRVERLIDDATGLMRVMKSPCIVLEGVDYTGETLRFAAQEEHLYWREVWLAPVDRSTLPS